LHAHAHTRARTHACTHAHTHTRMHTHHTTHTHVGLCFSACGRWFKAPWVGGMRSPQVATHAHTPHHTHHDGLSTLTWWRFASLSLASVQALLVYLTCGWSSSCSLGGQCQCSDLPLTPGTTCTRSFWRALGPPFAAPGSGGCDCTLFGQDGRGWLGGAATRCREGWRPGATGVQQRCTRTDGLLALNRASQPKHARCCLFFLLVVVLVFLYCLLLLLFFLLGCVFLVVAVLV
jgi:hypothetical protein